MVQFIQLFHHFKKIDDPKCAMYETLQAFKAINNALNTAIYFKMSSKGVDLSLFKSDIFTEISLIFLKNIAYFRLLLFIPVPFLLLYKVTVSR